MTLTQTLTRAVSAQGLTEPSRGSRQALSALLNTVTRTLTPAHAPDPHVRTTLYRACAGERREADLGAAEWIDPEPLTDRERRLAALPLKAPDRIPDRRLSKRKMER
jgi:hypothetical protein